MSKAQQTQLGALAIALLALGFIAAVMVSNTLLKGWRLDLTENKLYTISEGTRKVLADISEPINLYFFFSDEATEEVPFLRSYAFRIQEMLEEFVSAANGKLILSVVDPIPFSEEEDRASQFGLQSISLGTLSENVFLGLAATNSIGEQETIPFFQPAKESFLEYDLAKLIYSLARTDKTVIGLLSGVAMTVGFDPQTQQMREPWVVTNQARQLFEIRTLNSTLTEIDEEIDLLWLVQPKDLSDTALYAIDQFIMAGGNALIFVDPLAEIDMAAAGPNPQAMMPGGPSALQPLLDKWGVIFSPNQVVVDDQFALSVSGGFGQRPIRHLGLLGVDRTGLNAEDIITAELNSINVGTAGFFTLAEESRAQLAPLITSSANAATLPADRFRFLPDPQTLRDDFAPSGESYTIAARLEGELPSAFPDGPPPVPALDDAQADQPPAAAREHLAASAGAVGVILVADVDLLSDRLWVEVRRIFGQQIPSAFANNGDFVINALDNLTGSADLISIRSRASFARPFTTVEALRREADAKFRATEQRLEAQLDETEQRLGELQAARSDGNSLLLTPEQQAEVDRFIAERSRIRKELRAVRRDLDKDIERLGTRLKIINIALVPALITIAALVMLLLSRRRRGPAS